MAVKSDGECGRKVVKVVNIMMKKQCGIHYSVLVVENLPCENTGRWKNTTKWNYTAWKKMQCGNGTVEKNAM